LPIFTIASLFVFALGAGRVLFRALGGGGGRDGESIALAGAAGLGLTAVLLGVLGLAGRLEWARWILPAGSVLTLAAAARRSSSWRRPHWRRPSAGEALLSVMVVVACLGAIAPTTEFDSLAYPIPIARHLAEEGLWRFWPDQVRSVFPLSQELLLVPLIQAGSLQIGLVSAAEFVLAAWLIVSLARRVTPRADAAWIAALITLGCPAAAFLAASAKEDLLLLTMTTAAAVSLVSPPSLGAAARAGLFAGFAMGAKFTGVPIALATIAFVPVCCGRTRPIRHLAAAVVVAVAAGGLWYGVNLARFGNPVPIVSLGPRFSPPLMPPAVITDWANGFGAGRGLVDAIVAPFHMAVGSEIFGGRGNWINPLAFLGLVVALLRGLRRAVWALVVIALVAYVAWFREIQVARLLLPALALLSIPAADLLARLRARSRIVRASIGLALLASGGVVAAVGAIRVERYVSDPSAFLERETPHYADIAWMNTHLDPARDRVASLYEASGYLRVPWASLNATYQIEFGADDLDDPVRLRTALARGRFTYLFGPPDAFTGLVDALELVRANPASRVGGSSFFREPRTEATAIYRIR
jgi:hypothetical protein